MKLSKTDTKYMLSALYSAIESSEALIEAHQIKSIKQGGTYIRVIPSEYRKNTNKWKRQIVVWYKLIQKMSNNMK